MTISGLDFNVHVFMLCLFIVVHVYFVPFVYPVCTILPSDMLGHNLCLIELLNFQNLKKVKKFNTLLIKNENLKKDTKKCYLQNYPG